MDEDFSVLLSKDAAQLLEELSSQQGATKRETIRQAIALLDYFLKEKERGAKILILRPGEGIREVFLR